jgi:Ca2+-binding EF-hand superfamily protein
MARHHILLVVILPLFQVQPAFAETNSAETASRKMKVFILAGQSNMVGWGDSLKLSDDLRRGNNRVLMFENNRWQPLRPIRKVMKNQEKFGMTEFSFGPEIAFGHAMAKGWPEETIGIVKLAVGGTSILTWKPEWSQEDANRVGQGRVGSLYQRLKQKTEQAQRSREMEIVGFLWIQGGGDMKNVSVAKEYLDNLKSLVAAVRKDTGVPSLPFFCGTIRRTNDPADLSDLVPERNAGPYPAIQWVLKAQWEAQKEIPYFRTVILRDVQTHPKNVHYDTEGQLEVGRLFAQEFLDSSFRIGDHTPRQILAMLGARGRDDATDDQFKSYRRIFGFIDANRDDKHSWKEFVEDGRYLTPEARAGIFRASDSDSDGIVTLDEYIENRIITDEAKVIFEEIDANADGKVIEEEFLASGKIDAPSLAKAVFDELDSDGDGKLVIPEYLRVWGRWVRIGRTTSALSGQ